MPQTLQLDGNSAAGLAQAAALLRAGKLVAFPTETVYGLGAHALDEAAVRSIFAAKERPSWDPVIVHLADAADLYSIADIEDAELSRRVQLLAAAFWPGPLTMLLPRTSAVPDAVTAGRNLVGVRIPAHPVAQALLCAGGVPVAAPSANRFGHTSPTTAAHVLADLDGRIDAVIDGGPTSVGVESTVLDVSQAVVYRPGAVTAEAISAVLGVPITAANFAQRSTSVEALPSPGVGIRHYAPRARVQLVQPAEDEQHSLLEAMEHAQQNGLKVGALLPDGWAILPGVWSARFGNWDDPESLARNLFAGLRELDDRGAAIILVPLPAAGGVRDALRDRLLKAAMQP